MGVCSSYDRSFPVPRTIILAPVPRMGILDTGEPICLLHLLGSPIRDARYPRRYLTLIFGCLYHHIRIRMVDGRYWYCYYSRYFRSVFLYRLERKEAGKAVATLVLANTSLRAVLTRSFFLIPVGGT